MLHLGLCFDALFYERVRWSIFVRAPFLKIQVDQIYEIWCELIPLQPAPNSVLLEDSSVLRRYIAQAAKYLMTFGEARFFHLQSVNPWRTWRKKEVVTQQRLYCYLMYGIEVMCAKLGYCSILVTYMTKWRLCAFLNYRY
jgi:hypothetical protein